MFWLPYSCHTSQHPSQTPCLPRISYATQKLMLDSYKIVQKQPEEFHTFLWHLSQVQNRILLYIVLLKCPHVQITFSKFTSCDNQALVGCILIPAEAVHLNLKHKIIKIEIWSWMKWVEIRIWASPVGSTWCAAHCWVRWNSQHSKNCVSLSHVENLKVKDVIKVSYLN